MLIEKIKNKDTKVGIAGLGYVALPLAFGKAGFAVTRLDADTKKVEQLMKEGAISNISPPKIFIPWI